MTVNFTAIAQSEYDHALRTVMVSARGSVGAKVFSILCRGLSLSVPSDDVRRWIQLNGKNTFADGAVVSDRNRDVTDVDPALPIERQGNVPISLASFVDRGATWRRFVNAAERRILSSTSLSGDDLRNVRLDYTRWMYAGLLIPLPAMADMKISGLANLLSGHAFLSKRIIEHETGWDRTAVAQGWMAVHLGWDTPRTAGRHLERLVALHLFTNPQGGPRVVGKYSLRQVSRVSLAKMKRYEESIVAYVDGKPDALAAIIKSVDHPIWGYSGALGHEHRLVLMADAAEIPVRSLGVTVKKEREIRKVLDAAQLSRHTAHRDLVRILDGLATDPEYGRRDPVTNELVTPLILNERAWVAWQVKSDARILADSEREAAKVIPAEDEAVEVLADAEGWHLGLDAAAEIDHKLNEVLEDWSTMYPLPHNPLTGDPADADEREEQFAAWMLGVHGDMSAANAPAEFRASIGDALIARMLHLAYTEDFARGAIRYILEAPADSDYVPYLTGEAVS